MITAVLALIKAYWREAATAIVVVAVIVAAWAAWTRHGSEQYDAGKAAADQEWSLKWSQRNVADAAATIAQNEAERAEKARRDAVQQQVIDDAVKDKEQAQRDADSAQRSADQLHQQLANLRDKYSASEAGRVSAVTGRGQDAAATVVLLSDMLVKLDSRAGEIAKFADDAWRASQRCEQFYNGIANEQGE